MTHTYPNLKQMSSSEFRNTMNGSILSKEKAAFTNWLNHTIDLDFKNKPTETFSTLSGAQQLSLYQSSVISTTGIEINSMLQETNLVCGHACSRPMLMVLLWLSTVKSTKSKSESPMENSPTKIQPGLAILSKMITQNYSMVVSGTHKRSMFSRTRDLPSSQRASVSMNLM